MSSLAKKNHKYFSPQMEIKTLHVQHLLFYIGRDGCVEESLDKHEKRSRTIGITFTSTVVITSVAYIPQSSLKKKENNILHCQ